MPMDAQQMQHASSTATRTVMPSLDEYAADDESLDDRAPLTSAHAHAHDHASGGTAGVGFEHGGGGIRVFLECAARDARMPGFDADAAAMVAIDFVLKWIGQGNVLFDAVSWFTSHFCCRFPCCRFTSLDSYSRFVHL